MRETFEASGRVGADLLRVDWAATSLGDPEAWSLSLRNAIRILLSSRFSMWMAWGPDLTFFCNDAYRRDTLGSKYPWALGRRSDEVWSEIWPDIGPRIDHVMATGEATWDEALLLFLERSGYPEETYHTFSYSPLADDDGAIAGMLCVVTEDTQQVVTTNRMATLSDLGVRIGAASDEHAAVTQACRQLELADQSVPFALVYLFDDEGATAWRAGTAGIGPDHPAAPALVRVADGAGVWPAAEAWEGRGTVVPLTTVPGDLPTGGWAEPPTEAYVVPLLQAAADHPYGFLVAALNRYRPFDAPYRDFLELIAGHLSAAISDSRAIEAERQRAESLARLDEAKTDFFANVSHELRTPLTLLLGPAEDALADRDEPLGPAQTARVETIARNGQRMLQLVNTLLDFSRLEAGRLDATYRRTDLGQLTSELASMFQSAAERAGLDLQIECPGETVAYVDRDQWSKVVLNLVSNALKFTFEGGVTVSVGSADGQVVLSVADTGTGIPEDDLPRLFERFHRVRGTRSRTHEGTGIGLALVSELVQAHGGTVEVVSKPGQGSTFTVRLPSGHAHLPAEHVDHEAGDAPVTADGQTRSLLAQALSWFTTRGERGERDEEASVETGEVRPRVLVVDDNADMRAYIADLLRPAHEVVVAVDGLDALARINEQRPDLVLTDVMMPRLDGFGLLRRMREEPSLATIPLIMLSARAGEEGTLEGLEAGANDYLAKPFSARELLARVAANLELDRAQRVRQALEQSEELLVQAQRLARTGSWEIDLDNDTIIASRVFYEMMQMTPEEMERLGTTAVITSLVHPDDLADVTARLDAAVEGELVEYETRIVPRDGIERRFHLRGEVVPRSDGRRVLRGSFQDVSEQRATQARLAAAQAEREAASRERLVAEQLQASLLPASEFALDSLEVAAYYRAGVEGTQVGGDWYDVIDLGAGRTAFVIGDVMGRGVRAAAVMGQLRAAVRAFATLGLPPVDVLEHLDHLVQDLATDQIVTCAYAVHDPVESTITFANAGHLPPLLAGDGLAEIRDRLRATGPPLGAGYFGMEEQVVSLADDDVVVLYTDGLVERRGTDLLLGIEQLAGTLAELGGTPLPDMLARIVERLVTGAADDDVALVAVRPRNGCDSVQLRLRLEEAGTAPGQARRAVRRQLEAWDVDPGVVDDVVLITSELVTNAFIHARPPIDVALRLRGREVVLEVQDRALLRPRRRRPDDDDEHGRGLNIVEVLADSWGTRASESGKTVWCALRLDGSR